MSLIAHFPLCGNYNDYSGNNTPATASNLAYEDGKIGKAGLFNNSSVTIRNADIKLGSAFSVALWVKSNMAYPSADANTNWRSIIGKVSGGNTGQQCFYLDWYGSNSTRTLRYGVGNSIMSQRIECNNFDLTQWTHIAFSHKDRKMFLYVNGELRSTSESSFDMLLTSDDIRIGKFFTDFIGLINDVRIYDHVLSIKEIKEIAKGKIADFNYNAPIVSTVNIAKDQRTVSNSSIVNNYGWDKALHQDAIQVRDWSIGYNSGVPAAETGYHARWVFDADGVTPIMRFPNLNNSPAINQPGRWLGISSAHDASLFTGGETYTISWEQKVDEMNQGAKAGIYHKITSSTSANFHNSSISAYFTNKSNGVWEKKTYTFTLSSDFDTTYNPQLYVYGNRTGSYGGNVWVRNVQVERRTFASDFTETERTNRIADCSDYTNIAVLDKYTSPAWNNKSYSFNKSCIAVTEGMLIDGNVTEELTIAAWIKLDSYAKGEDRSIVAKKNYYLSVKADGCLSCYWYGKAPAGYHDTTQKVPLNKWTHVAAVWSKTQLKMYIDGVLCKTVAVTGTATVVPWQFTMGSEGNITTGVLARFLYGCIDDVKLFATALSDQDVKELMSFTTSINKAGYVFTDDIITYENLGYKYDNAIKDKTFKDGLTFFQQSNCTCSLTDDGYRIVREPNLDYPSAGNVMWGGFRIILPNGLIIPDRKYKIVFDYKGKSTNAMETYFALQSGWSGQAGLRQLDIDEKVNMQGENYNSEYWETAQLKFSYSYSDIYQIAKSTQGICTEGQLYNCTSEFKLGYRYESTGALGTDIYIKNFRIYDITDGDTGIQKTGIRASAINEVGICNNLIAYYPFDKDTRDYSGNVKHLTGTYVEANGIKNQAINITNSLKTTLSFPASGTVSAWGKHTVNNGQMLFSFNTDAVYGPNLYFAHEAISWNTGDGGLNPFIKDGIIQGYTSINQWHHYVVVINAKLNKVTLYIDGEYAGDATYKSPEQTSSKTFVIGASRDETSYVWQGYIDNVKLSSSCWSEQEIKIEYETTANNKVLINKDGTIYANCFDETLV